VSKDGKEDDGGEDDGSFEMRGPVIFLKQFYLSNCHFVSSKSNEV
jgi:hypothetical protein